MHQSNQKKTSVYEQTDIYFQNIFPEKTTFYAAIMSSEESTEPTTTEQTTVDQSEEVSTKKHTKKNQYQGISFTAGATTVG